MIKNIGIFKDYTDDSLKTVFDVGDNQIIEMTLLANRKERDVVCVPTHHFCNLGCKMCHLTNENIDRDMVPVKIDDFMEAFYQTVTDINGKRRTNKKDLLISFMGVGDPLLNIKLVEEVYDKESEIKERLGYENVGYALATMMPNTNILKLADIVNRKTIPLKIHFSLHTPINDDRYELLPSTKVSVEEALRYLVFYRDTLQANGFIMKKYNRLHSTNDPVEIHYTLMKNINDSDKELDKLCEQLEEYKIPIKFLKFNPINDLEISENEDKWVETINKRVPNLRVKRYSPPGREIGSSCGEFTKHYYHEEIETKEEKKEFEEWKIKHQIYA